MAKNQDGYLSAKESRRISKENRRITDQYEKQRKRKNVPESEYLTQMKNPENAVEFDNLHTYFFTDTGVVKSVDGVSFEVPVGKTVGVVGESGCGKSVTSLSLMQLLQRPQGQIVEGSIRLNLGDGKAYDIAKTPTEKMQGLRGNYVSMIFQEPMTSLNPVFRIGAQIEEVIALHEGEGKTKEDIKKRTIEMLETVGIANSNGVSPDQYLMTSLLDSASTPSIFLIGSGIIMVVALLTSKKAHNVIKTSLDLSRQEAGEESFGTSPIARKLVRMTTNTSSFIVNNIPPKARTWLNARFDKDEVILEHGAAFDLIRASVNLVLASLLIALGTSLKLPLSTTYVTFMVAMGTSLADRAWGRDSAVYRITGVISVIGGWFLTAGAAFLICFTVTMIVYFGGSIAIILLGALAAYMLIHSQISYNKKLKQEKNAVILAHYYVRPEVQDIADYIGDSFYLSRVATELSESTIVFCGVSFMGESAKILNPDKTVLMPDPTADCPMAHMADVESIKKVREEYEDVAVVCYINSTAALKEYSDVCVTSANAVKIVKALPNKNIYFIPDRNLAHFVADQVPEKHFIYNEGFCPTHERMEADEVREAKEEHPDALVLSHPECNTEVLKLSDYIGSTSGIIKYATESPCNEFIICTEEGVHYKLVQNNPDKHFYYPKTVPVCPNMKKNTLEKVLHVLKTGKNEVHISDSLRENSKKPLERMLELGK